MTSSTRVLDPIDRVSEVLFGLIMVLTFTGSLSVAEAGRDDVRTMLIGALGCNVAWGIIDAMLYLMGSLAEKSQGLMTYLAVRKATDPQQAQRLIADALPPVVASILEPAELETMRRRLMQLPEPPERARLEQGRLAGCHRRVSPRVRLHVSGGDPVHFHAERRAGPACVQCHRHRDVVSDRLRLRKHDRASPVARGYCDGCSRVHARRHDHGTGRIVTCDYLPAWRWRSHSWTTLSSPRPRRTCPSPRRRTRRPTADEEAWSFSASAYTYFVPDDSNYVQPTFTADRGWLHLEARYNYEALDTGSAWIGYNFSGGEKLAWEVHADDRRRVWRHHRHRAGLQRLAELVEARTLQRGRVCLRHGQFLGQFLLQLVGADAGAGRVVSVRHGDAADAGLRRPIATSSAACSRASPSRT